MGRLMAIDYGTKRTGIAVTDTLKIIATGLATVSSHSLINFIKEYTNKETVDCIIVGAPKQTNNEPSENMKFVERFVRSLNKEIPEIPVKLYDERFTSVMAHKAMIDGGLKKKDRQNKALVDEISAVILLQSYMESSFYKKGTNI
ncbi:Holliday junction resolvase RuvX [Dysgonomonas sp. 216]|uniref:Holliday junction resolvase RuvX n=1 Tax=Dysgonomonas sp. 216 TaxID=2302934 RepID=UPI0013D02A1C|nr:Holliday junction resolvase RuvX [Dysgonomonas sp. 216]NDW18384.1 Holliday junction resolvase RuvX [Dysgonomonas sp. 216]